MTVRALRGADDHAADRILRASFWSARAAAPEAASGHMTAGGTIIALRRAP